MSPDPPPERRGSSPGPRGHPSESEQAADPLNREEGGVEVAPLQGGPISSREAKSTGGVPKRVFHPPLSPKVPAEVIALMFIGCDDQDDVEGSSSPEIPPHSGDVPHGVLAFFSQRSRSPISRMQEGPLLLIQDGGLSLNTSSENRHSGR